MAGETFYTYLHGPRTFWGNSGSNIRINNNFGFPCTPPMMNGCGCNYGSSNSIWPAMMMFNSMMAQTLPLWNFGKSEGAGASDTTGTTESLDKLTSTRRTLDQIGFTQAAGYSLLLDESGNVIYRYNNGGNEYTASSMAELTAKISARTSEATNEGTSEGTSEGAGSSDSVISVDDSASVQDTDEVEATNEEASASDDSTDTVRHSTEGAGSSTSTRKFKRGKLNKGWEWTTYAKLQNSDLKNKIADKNCKTAVDIMKAVYPNWANKSDAEIKGSLSYKLLIDANPGAINNNGKIVNKNKLDLFVRKQTTTPAATNSSGNNTREVTVNGTKFKMIKNSNGSYTYKRGNTTINAATFANAAPEAFIKEHNRNWTAEDLQAILLTYDSRNISGHKDSNKKHFNSVHVSKDGNNIKVSVYYKGNGVLSYWKWTSSFNCSKTNGKIKWDISDIYEDLNKGY